MSEAQANTLELGRTIEIRSHVGARMKLEPWAVETIKPWLAEMSRIVNRPTAEPQSATNWFDKWTNQSQSTELMLGLLGEVVGRGELATEKLLYAYYLSTTKATPKGAIELARVGGEWLKLTFSLFGGEITNKEFQRLFQLLSQTTLNRKEKESMKQWLASVYKQRSRLVGDERSIQAAARQLSTDQPDKGGGGESPPEEGGQAAGGPSPKKENFWEQVGGALRRFWQRLLLNRNMGRLIKALGLGPESLEQYAIDVGAFLLRVGLTVAVAFFMSKAIGPLRVWEGKLDPAAEVQKNIEQYYSSDQWVNYLVEQGFIKDVLDGGVTMLSIRNHLDADWTIPNSRTKFMVTVDAFRIELSNQGFNKAADPEQAIYDYMRSQNYSDAEARYFSRLGKEILETNFGGTESEYQDVLNQAEEWQDSGRLPQRMVTELGKIEQSRGKLRGTKAALPKKRWFPGA